MQEGRFLIQKCGRCGAFRYYPRSACPRCLSMDFVWEESAGRGRVYSVTTVERAPADFDLPAPYQVALVDLTEGVRVLANVAPGHTVAIGDEVRVAYRSTPTGLRLPVFTR